MARIKIKFKPKSDCINHKTEPGRGEGNAGTKTEKFPKILKNHGKWSECTKIIIN